MRSLRGGDGLLKLSGDPFGPGVDRRPVAEVPGREDVADRGNRSHEPGHEALGDADRTGVGIVVDLALVIAGLAVADAGITLGERWMSSRIGEGLIYDLRRAVFGHQKGPGAWSVSVRAEMGASYARSR